MITMTPAEAADVLRKHNTWRRGNNDDTPLPQTNPVLLGEAIDAALLHLTAYAERIKADEGAYYPDGSDAPIRDNPPAQAAQVEFVIHCDGVSIDVSEVYRKAGFEKLPPTVTLSAMQILAFANRPAGHGLFPYIGEHKAYGDNEAIILTPGMRFLAVPPATYGWDYRDPKSRPAVCTAEPVAQGEASKLLAYLDQQSKSPTDQFGNGSNKPNPTLKAWYAKQAAIVRALAAQGQGDVDELFNTFRLAYYGSNKSLAPQMESFRRAYKAIAPAASPAVVPDADDMAQLNKAVEDWNEGEYTDVPQSTLMRLTELGLLVAETFEVTKKGMDLLAAAPSAPEGGETPP